MKNQAEMTMKTPKSGFAYTVTVDGVVVGTRKSKRANYTCAAVKLVDRDKVLACRLSQIEAGRKEGSVVRKNYIFGISEAAVDRIAADCPSIYSPERIEKEKSEKRAYLAKYPTFEAYLNEAIQQAHTSHAKAHQSRRLFFAIQASLTFFTRQLRAIIQQKQATSLLPY